MYRPHFAYSTPAGCRDESFEFPFDSSDMTVQSVSPLGTLYSVLFPLSKDAEFRWRGVKIGIQDVSVPLEIQWKTPSGDVMSDVVSNSPNVPIDPATINTVLYATGSGFSPDLGGIAVPWDEEIICPAGSVIEANFFRPLSGSSVNVPTNITLLGVKRYYSGQRAA